jgi:UDP-glucuronate 4-epimerase
LPFRVEDRVDQPLSLYAATKKADELISETYAHLYRLPLTGLRFFTVYGPWGRPDMALFKFVEAILKGEPIDIYNRGEMSRDFTYVDDLVAGIRRLIDTPPVRPASPGDIEEGDSLSPVAPFRIVNIGNSDQVRLLDFIEAIETELGKQAVRNYMPMQKGDVPATWADTSLLRRITGSAPKTDYRDGIRQFVRWYREYYGI